MAHARPDGDQPRVIQAGGFVHDALLGRTAPIRLYWHLTLAFDRNGPNRRATCSIFRGLGESFGEEFCLALGSGDCEN